MKAIVTILLFLFGSFAGSAQDIFNRTQRHQIDITYQPSLPTIYGSLLVEKQRLYNERAEAISSRLSLLRKTISQSSLPEKEMATCRNLVNAFVESENKYNYDYTDPGIWRNCSNSLDQMEEVIFTKIRKN